MTIASNYEGQAAVPFVAPAILSADTIANGFCSVLENVRYKTNLRKLDNGTVSARSCTFDSPTTPLDISDVQLVTTELQVNEEICNHELAQTWAAEQMRGGFASIPADYERFIGQYLARKTAEAIEQTIWQGNYDSTGRDTPPNPYPFALFDGIMHHIVDASPTADTTVQAAFTAANIGTNLGNLIATVPDAIIGDPDAKLYMSRKTFQLYFQFLAASNNNPVLAAEVAKSYLGYEIYCPAGFPDDTLLVSRVDNLYFGTNVLTDMNEARFVDLRNTTGADQTRIVMLFDAGTQIVDGDSLAVLRYTQSA